MRVHLAHSNEISYKTQIRDSAVSFEWHFLDSGVKKGKLRLKKGSSQSSWSEELLTTVSRESAGSVRKPQRRGSLAMNPRAMPGEAAWHIVALSYICGMDPENYRSKEKLRSRKNQELKHAPVLSKSSTHDQVVFS